MHSGGSKTQPSNQDEGWVIAGSGGTIFFTLNGRLTWSLDLRAAKVFPTEEAARAFHSSHCHEEWQVLEEGDRFLTVRQAKAALVLSQIRSPLD